MFDFLVVFFSFCSTRSVRDVVKRWILHDVFDSISFFRIVSGLWIGTVRLGSKKKWSFLNSFFFSKIYLFEWYPNIFHSDLFSVSKKLVPKEYCSVANEFSLQSNECPFVDHQRQNLNKNLNIKINWIFLFSPWESRFNSSSLIISVVIKSCFVCWFVFEWLSSASFFCKRFFRKWFVERIAAAACSADERFFDGRMWLLSMLIFGGVVFSIDNFCRHLRDVLPFEFESNCS